MIKYLRGSSSALTSSKRSDPPSKFGDFMVTPAVALTEVEISVPLASATATATALMLLGT